jgi:VanZ family protein
VRTTISISIYPLRKFLSLQTERRWAFFLFPLLAYAALIFYGSSQSRWFFEPPEFFSSDKVYHLLEYSVFGVLVARIIEEYRFSPSFPKKLIGVLAISLLYGISDEFHQWFIPGRSATFGDVLADGLGGGLGGWLYFKLSASYRLNRVPINLKKNTRDHGSQYP